MSPMFEAFELAAQYRQLAEQLAERQDDPRVISDTLESLSEPLDEQLENLAKMVRNIEAADSGVVQTMSNLEARHAALQRAAERGRHMILEVMRTAGRERASTALFSLAIKRNPPHVVIDRQTELPPTYLTYHEPPPPTPNRKAIAAALKAGMPVPGAHAEQGVRLEIH
ncbi:MAG: siphovirus family protein [Herminiimonas sp.]|jgi:ABC-type transporter Mla subunit MlaD|nr:siphovirus family protein [Herminiimonas sp.]